MNHFHAGGREAYGKAMRRDYEAKILALRAQLQSAPSEEEKRQVTDDLRRLKIEYREKIEGLGKSLF